MAEARAAFSPEMRRAVEAHEGRRPPRQEQVAHEADLRLQFSPNHIEKAIGARERPGYVALKKKLAALEQRLPQRPQTFGFYAPRSAAAVEVLAHLQHVGELDHQNAVLADQPD